MTARITTPRGRRLTWSMALIWVVASLLVVAAWGVVAELTQRDGQEVLARARRDTGNLARTIAEQTTRAMSDTDRILNFLAYDLGHRGVDRPRLQDVLKNAIDGSDLLLQLSYTDAAGTVIESSVDGPMSVVNIADREHFLVHKEGTVQGMFISRPVLGRASGKWSIQLSRRITAPDGSFAGVMVASLDPFYFSRTFDDLDIGKRGVLAIVGRDGILRARTGLNEAIIGRNVSETPPFRAAMTATQGFVQSVSAIDGIARLISFRTVARYPLVVLVGFDKAGFLADMQAMQRLYVVAACVATAMLLVMAVLMSWHMRVQDQARATAEHASHLKSEFLATISHEIRTPMNGVLGMLALLESDPLTPRQKHQAGMARRSAEGLLVLLDDILDFSRLEAGKSIADQGNCEPAQIVRSVIDLLRPKAEEKGLGLSMHVGPSVPDVVVTDPTRLRQILFNLVGNALKFTSAGEVSVRVQRGADLPD
ncbi:MAG: histidine kinase dimerization/phospho-acceptor domain-containing protein, partial [Acetobacteraceae bacterium]|nr:histidine kinase dimerization/phospho-acceptor domain-containing protein [Acetobacteraceae bacterium]